MAVFHYSIKITNIFLAIEEQNREKNLQHFNVFFIGEDLAYIYPDMKMAIRGEFKDEKLGKLFFGYCSFRDIAF